MEAGDIVFNQWGKPIILIKELRDDDGAEGNIFLTDSKDVVKVFKSSHLTEEKRQKISLLIKKRLRYPGICFPESLINDKDGNFIGYSMAFAEGKKMQLSLFIRANLETQFYNWNRINLINVSLTILNMFEYLHKNEILVGDVSASNILIKSDTEIFLVDLDSVQVENFPCTVHTVLFTAPELQGKNFRTILRKKEHEYYAITTLLFMIFLPGKNPFAYQGGGDLAESIKAMNFSYPLVDEDNNRAPSGIWEYIWIELSYDVRKTFKNTFKKGKRFSIAHWKNVLETYKKELINDVYSKRIFPSDTVKIDSNIAKSFKGDVTDKEYWLRKDKTELTLIKYNPKIGVIELSTNAIKLLFGDQEKILKDGFQFGFFARNYSAVTDTGSATNSNGIIDLDFVDRVVIEKIDSLVQISKSNRIDVLYTVATAAYRAAKNRDKVIEMILLNSGINVKILKKKEEAQSAIRAYLHARPKNIDYDPHKNYMFIDQGGGSTEISVFFGQEIKETYSMDLGTTVLRSILFTEATESTSFDKAFKDAEKLIKDRLQGYLQKYNPQNLNSYCIAVGNAIIQATGAENAFEKHGKVMDIPYLRNRIEFYDNEIRSRYTNLRHLHEELEREKYEQMDKSKKSNQVINTLNGRLALQMFIEIMQRFRIEKIISSNVGVCYGIFFEKLLTKNQ